MAIIETLSTSSMISSLSSSCTTTNKIMDDPFCNDTLLTTYFGFSTTIAAGTFKDDLNKKINIEISHQYIESLSDEELAQLTTLASEKYEELTAFETNQKVLKQSIK